MVGESDLISETFTLYDSTQIRGRPTLNDAERFRTGLKYVASCKKKCSV